MSCSSPTLHAYMPCDCALLVDPVITAIENAEASGLDPYLAGMLAKLDPGELLALKAEAEAQVAAAELAHELATECTEDHDASGTACPKRAAPAPGGTPVPVLNNERAVIFHGDSSKLELPENSIDAIVSDPPAGIGFMGAEWDSDKGGAEEWINWLAELLRPWYRALKPGGHVLLWAIPRTSDWTMAALRRAGFEIRDQVHDIFDADVLAQNFVCSLDAEQQAAFLRLLESQSSPILYHLFGSGFPKSRNISIDIDALLGKEREVIAPAPYTRGASSQQYADGRDVSWNAQPQPITAPASPEASQWNGWGTAFKPAAEHWILARKPLELSIARNVLKWGTGALNIDACRIPVAEGETIAMTQSDPAKREGVVGAAMLTSNNDAEKMQAAQRASIARTQELGRWPAHLVLDDHTAALLDAQTGPRDSHGADGSVDRAGIGYGAGGKGGKASVPRDKGGASRFFYVAKPPRKEKEAGLDHLPVSSAGEATGGRKEGSAGLNNPRAGAGRTGGARNTHPTVKSIELMRWLVRFVTPKGGIVADMFAGSGTTLIAGLEEGMRVVGCELTDKYIPIVIGRVQHALTRLAS
jgi:hypothetical protein